MEQTLKVCDWHSCNSTFTPKRDNHRFCCDSHRKKWNRVNKGVSELPKFFKKDKNLSETQFKTTSPVKFIPENYTHGIELNRTMYSIPQRVNRKSNLRYVLPALTFGFSSLNGNDGFSTLLLTGAAYLLGNNLDKSSKNAIDYTYPVLDNRQFVKKKKKRKKKQTLNKIMSGQEYTNIHIDSIGIKDKYKYLFGDPGPGFYMLVTGMPGNGKSTFAIKLGQYFQENHGKVLFLAGEQSGMNKPLQNLLKMNGVTFDIDTKPSKKASEIIKVAKGYSMLIIDSVNHLNLAPYDIREIKKSLPKLSIVGIMQSTKEGNFKGSQEYLHDCDIRINCVDMIANQTKSRFAPKSEIPIL